MANHSSHRWSVIAAACVVALMTGACSRTATIDEAAEPVEATAGGDADQAEDSGAVDVDTTDDGTDDADEGQGAESAATDTEESDEADGATDTDGGEAGDGATDTEESDEGDGATDTDGGEAGDRAESDDPVIMDLVADCNDGSDMACDILFQVSGYDTPEELTAMTCGGRSPDNFGFCTDAILPDGANLWLDETSPGLPAVVTACEDGDMTACDFLYFRSAIESTYEAMGNTCAGRVEIALPDCRTMLGDDG